MLATSSAMSSSKQITWPQCTQTFRAVATPRGEGILKVAYEGEVLQLWLEDSSQHQYYLLKSKDECEGIFAGSGFEVALVQEMLCKAAAQEEGFSLGFEWQGEVAVLLQLCFRYMQKAVSFRLLQRNLGEVDSLERHVETTEVRVQAMEAELQAQRQARGEQPPRHEQQVAELRRELEELRAQQLAFQEAMKAEMVAEMKALREELALKRAEALAAAKEETARIMEQIQPQLQAGAAIPARPMAGTQAPKRAKPRNVFIQMVGGLRVGKTMLLQKLITDCDPQQLGKFQEQRRNLMSHHHIQIGDSRLIFLDCSGHSRCNDMVHEWYARSINVCVVYDVANAKSLEFALERARDIVAEGARLILFGNLYNVESGKPVRANVSQAKDCAVRNNGLAIESSTLITAVMALK